MTQPTQRHILITGATGGIGRALVGQFAETGFLVSAVGRDAAKLEALGEWGPRVAPINGDFAKSDRSSSIVASAENRHGPVTDLIAAAAIYPKAHFLDEPPEQLSEVLRVNVVGVANIIRQALPGMLERNFGRVIVMGSLADMNPVPGSLAYSVSKGALHTLVKGIAGEIDRTRYSNVLVNEFSPGATRTAMSGSGHDPEDIFPMLLPLIECGADGPHGRFFRENREFRIGETWKKALKRIVLRR